MHTFNPHTALTITALLYLLMPLFAWVVLAGQRSRQVVLWCGGGLITGLSALLVVYREYFAFPVDFTLAVFLAITGSLMRIQSLRMDLGIAWRTSRMVIAAMMLFLVFEWLHFGVQNYVLRGQYLSSLLGGLFLYLAIMAWRIGQSENSLNAKWIALVYGLLGGVFILRIFLLIGRSGPVSLADEGRVTQFVAIAGILSAVIGHFGYVGLALDRSMRRELKAAANLAREEESRRLGEQIALLDRQRSLGEMSASLGHELNQPLTAILANAQVARRGLKAGRFDSQQYAELFDKIIYNTQRASKIIERIRGFIRPAATRKEPVDLNRVVQEVTDLIADELRSHKVTVVHEKSNVPVWVSGDPVQLSQIVLNILRNSIEALLQVARREIHIACHVADGRAMLNVRDTGLGMPADIFEQVGTPFFTTKQNGLGMGITISRSIAAQHAGTLRIANADVTQGVGTTVELNLPALPQVKL